MPELFDLVDEEDRVVGSTTKEESHAKGLLHRVASVYVFLPDGRLLVQVRKKDGLWDNSAAGHVRAGEDYDSAARRELAEELGLSRAELRSLGKVRSDEKLDPDSPLDIQHYFSLYETELGADEVTIAPEEVVEMVPMTLEELAEDIRKSPRKYTTGFKATLNFYIRHKNLGIEPVRVD